MSATTEAADAIATAFRQLTDIWNTAPTSTRNTIADAHPQLAEHLHRISRSDLTDDPDRCTNCDHLAAFHGAGGCWYTSTTARPGDDLVCTCPRTSVGTGLQQRRGNHAGDVDLIRQVITAQTHIGATTAAPAAIACTVLAALTVAGRLNPVHPTAATIAREAAAVTGETVTDWQRGYQACSDRVTAAVTTYWSTIHASTPEPTP